MIFRIFELCIHQVKEKTPPDLRGSETKTVFKRAVFFYFGIRYPRTDHSHRNATYPNLE